MDLGSEKVDNSVLEELMDSIHVEEHSESVPDNYAALLEYAAILRKKKRVRYAGNSSNETAMKQGNNSNITSSNEMMYIRSENRQPIIHDEAFSSDIETETVLPTSDDVGCSYAEFNQKRRGGNFAGATVLSEGRIDVPDVLDFSTQVAGAVMNGKNVVPAYSDVEAKKMKLSSSRKSSDDAVVLVVHDDVESKSEPSRQEPTAGLAVDNQVHTNGCEAADQTSSVDHTTVTNGSNELNQNGSTQRRTVDSHECAGLESVEDKKWSVIDYASFEAWLMDSFQEDLENACLHFERMYLVILYCS